MEHARVPSAVLSVFFFAAAGLKIVGLADVGSSAVLPLVPSRYLDALASMSLIIISAEALLGVGLAVARFRTAAAVGSLIFCLFGALDVAARGVLGVTDYSCGCLGPIELDTTPRLLMLAGVAGLSVLVLTRNGQ